MHLSKKQERYEGMYIFLKEMSGVYKPGPFKYLILLKGICKFYILKNINKLPTQL